MQRHQQHRGEREQHGTYFTARLTSTVAPSDNNANAICPSASTRSVSSPRVATSLPYANAMHDHGSASTTDTGKPTTTTPGALRER